MQYIVIISLSFLSASILGWSAFQYLTYRKTSFILDHLIEENKQLKQQNIRIALDAQERERAEIGRDLHDELGSTLLTMKMNLGLVEKQGLFIFESSDALKELKYALEGAIDYVKGISRVTSPAFLENFGLSKAVLQMVKRINTSCVAKVEFTETGEGASLSKEKQLHVFRIIQEVTNNALRHASPWKISVTFLWAVDSLTVDIRDDGYNHRLSDTQGSTGLGLNNIMNRTSLIGAQFTHEDLPVGNLVRIRVPYETINENHCLPSG